VRRSNFTVIAQSTTLVPHIWLQDVGANSGVEEDKKVCHKGYVSIFPLLLGLVPRDSPHLGPLLDIMSDPAHLWSDYGLRSLSKSDPYYSQGENYWRGPIWINMNYLALSSLYKVPPQKPRFSQFGFFGVNVSIIFPRRDRIRRRLARFTMNYASMS
jgi:glycogen debranching enzyme